MARIIRRRAPIGFFIAFARNTKWLAIMERTPSGRTVLFYYGTDIDVQLGDRVIWKRFFRSNVEGTVVYIPGISPRHPDLECEGVRQWAVELDDGSIMLMLYWPEDKKGQPRSNIKFKSRGTRKSLPPETRLH